MSGVLDRVATAWWLVRTVPDIAAVLLTAGVLVGLAVGWVGCAARLQRRIRDLRDARDRAYKAGAEAAQREIRNVAWLERRRR